MGWLEGYVAVITGGGSGIGRAIVDRFFMEGCKGIVVLVRDPAQKEQLIADYGNKICVVQGDVRSGEANQMMVEKAIEHFGRLDVAIGNAGVWDHFTSLQKMSLAQIDTSFDEIFSINTKAYLLLARAALNELRKSQGSIIFTLSNSAFYAGGGGPLYVASKHAGLGLVKQLAYELAPHVRVNGVAPGGTVTNLHGLESLGKHEQGLSSIPDFEAKVADSMPLQFIAKPEDHAAHFVLLASRENSPATTATVLQSDCGWEIRPLRAR